MNTNKDCECFFQHKATFSLSGYKTLDEAYKCSTQSTSKYDTPFILIETEPDNTSVLRVTLCDEGGECHAYFKVGALNDMIDHAANGRGILR